MTPSHKLADSEQDNPLDATFTIEDVVADVEAMTAAAAEVIRFEIATGNVQSNPWHKRLWVRSESTLLRHMNAQVYGLQEIAGLYHYWAFSAFGKAFSKFHFGLHEVPILVDNVRFQVIGKASFHAMPKSAKAHVSPTRYFSWVPLRRKPALVVRGGTRKVRDIVVINGHWVSHPEESGWRADRHEEMTSAVAAKVAEFYSKGYTVFVVGDMNKSKMRALHPDWQWLVNSGLDHIGVASKDAVRVVTTQRVNGRSDHDYRSATVEITAAA